MKLPNLPTRSQQKDVTETFYGYNHKLKIRPGEMYFTENMSTRDYPMMATRKRRSMVRRLTKPQGMLAKDKLCFVDNGTLYYDGEPTPVTGLSDSYKQLVSMGAYIVIFPDKVYYNTQDPEDHGNMEFTRTLTGQVRYSLCSVTAAEIGYTSSDTEPQNPNNGDYWYDTAHSSLKCYSASQLEWVSVGTVFTKIEFTGLDFKLSSFLKEHDAVDITGKKVPEVLKGTKALYAVGDNYIVVVGLLDTNALDAENDAVTLSRTVPALDYVCECQNRLWGCYYGMGQDGKMLNEIYCCALGDFKNWRVYMGLSTDSWTASVGSDGPWTGAINYLGYPTFFKKDTIHKVSVSARGAHSILETPARGVQLGSAKSLAIMNEILFYKSASDVMAFQGGFPSGISDALGEQMYSEAVGGVFGSRYYVSMLDTDRMWHLFCYDKNGLWMREDDLHVTDFARLDNSLFALDSDGVIWDLAGMVGETETRLHWTVQSGIQYYEIQSKLYTSRYDIMLSAPAGTSVDIEIQYDSCGIWRHSGHFFFKGANSVTIPVRPRRCNHLELRLTGEGDVKVFSIARILEQGSDV